MATSQTLGKHAVIIGGSVAGLLTAGVLAPSFERITVLERDKFPEQPDFRKGVPQGLHAHGLTMRAYQIMVGIFPGLPPVLAAHGAILDQDLGRTMLAHQYGAYWTTCDSDVTGTMVSRALLDWALRQELDKLSNVSFVTGSAVTGLVADNGRVTGVSIQPKAEGSAAETLTADLVVDAGGRGSQLPKWLEKLGYDAPEESEVRVNVGYSSRLYKRSIPDDAEPPLYMIKTTPPEGKRLAAIFPVEGNQWHVTLAGTCGDYPPTDEEGYRAFARTLPAPEASHIIENEEPVGDITLYKFPANQRRHYEKLTRFPDGLTVIGDAISSFNPIYGQGMTVSSLELAELAKLVAEPGQTLEGFNARFMKRITPVVDDAWQMATSEDFRYPEVEGKRPFGLGFMHRYMEAALRATHTDQTVHVTFLKIINMQKSPAAMFAPDIMWRIARNSFSNRK